MNIASSPSVAVPVAAAIGSLRFADHGSHSSFLHRVHFDRRHAIAGTCGGFTAITACYPLDVLKSQLAASPCGNIRDCLSRTYFGDGIRGFYRGMSFPLVGEVLIATVTYGVYGNFLSLLDGDRARSTTSVALAGSAAGLAASVVETPIDMLKTQMQLQPCLPVAGAHKIAQLGENNFVHLMAARQRVAHSIQLQTYTGVGNCLLEVHRGKRLFTGLNAVVLRNVPGFAVSYSAFEMSRNLLSSRGENPKDLPIYKTAIAGALSGAAFWLLCYPADLIRIAIQGVVVKNSTMTREQCITSTVKMLFHEGGVRRFYRGLSAALLRAVPANALSFSVYSTIVDHE